MGASLMATASALQTKGHAVITYAIDCGFPRRADLALPESDSRVYEIRVSAGLCTLAAVSDGALPPSAHSAHADIANAVESGSRVRPKSECRGFA